LNTKKLFVGIHQDCYVILSLARLLNFSPSRVDCGKDGKKRRRKSSRRKKSYLNLQPEAGESTKITEITELFPANLAITFTSISFCPMKLQQLQRSL
jgi:hypothetical protein